MSVGPGEDFDPGWLLIVACAVGSLVLAIYLLGDEYVW